IPDFVFARGGTRVFMEIAGFWSPSYRERKLSKLKLLAAAEEQAAFILALPRDAVETFSGLPFPVMPYKTGVRATDLISMLDAHYGQSEQRMDGAQERIDALKRAAAARDYVSEQEIAASLEAYTRSELLARARLLDGGGRTYVPGVGLLSQAAIDQLRASLREALEASANRIDLQEAARITSELLSAQQVDVEALLQLWPEWRIERPSLFEASVVA
ncbi:MAG TPA: DUF790 family protein, partial [Chloroflexia bacterium]|nr:DUF790 family protein [Chloroflexia bacterium]